MRVFPAQNVKYVFMRCSNGAFKPCRTAKTAGTKQGTIYPPKALIKNLSWLSAEDMEKLKKKASTYDFTPYKPVI